MRLEWFGYETGVVWVWDWNGLGMRLEWFGYETGMVWV